MNLEKLINLHEGVNLLSELQNEYYRKGEFFLKFCDDEYVSEMIATYEQGKIHNGYFYLEVQVHPSVPEKYLDIVIVHELKEADLLFFENKSIKDAHIFAKKVHANYARKTRTPKEFFEFCEWEQKQSGYSKE